MKTLVSNIKSASAFFSGRIPKQLVIQLTNRCNATCPQCGMRKSAHINRQTLPKETIKKIIDNSAKNGLSALSITGGEPLLYPETTKGLLLYANQKGIRYTRTGTNGFFFSKESSNYDKKVSSIAKLIKKSKARNFWISIDSANPGQHEKMRGFNRVIEGIYSGLPVFHENGVFPCANLGINRGVGGQKTLNLLPEHYNSKENYFKDFEAVYEQAFSNFFDFVSKLGFTMANCCYPMSIETCDKDLLAVYSATSNQRIVNFMESEKEILFKALMKAVTKYRSRLRIFTPISSLYELFHQYKNNRKPRECRGGKDFFFVDAQTGNIFPCGYRGSENLGIDFPKNYNDDFHCSLCDWECFRDPSSMLMPIADIASSPLSGFKKIKQDKDFYEIWKQDIIYYKAAEFFNGSKPPNYEKLKKFESKTAPQSLFYKLKNRQLKQTPLF